MPCCSCLSMQYLKRGVEAGKGLWNDKRQQSQIPRGKGDVTAVIEDGGKGNYNNQKRNKSLSMLL